MTEINERNKIVKYTGVELEKIKNAIKITDKLLNLKLQRPRTYEFVSIGYQKWAPKNLEVSCFRNGDLIPEVTKSDDWMHFDKSKQPAWCYYANNISNGFKYGKLYNWFAVIDKRGLAPEGWHIPSDDEWTFLTDYLGGENIAGIKMKEIFGLNTLLGGFRNLFGDFKLLDIQGRWWSSTSTKEDPEDLEAWFRILSHGGTFINYQNCIERSTYHKTQGYSVRCLKN